MRTRAAGVPLSDRHLRLHSLQVHDADPVRSVAAEQSAREVSLSYVFKNSAFVV